MRLLHQAGSGFDLSLSVLQQEKMTMGLRFKMLEEAGASGVAVVGEHLS